jgi:hypothetical protein
MRYTIQIGVTFSRWIDLLGFRTMRGAIAVAKKVSPPWPVRVVRSDMTGDLLNDSVVWERK